LNFRNLLIGTPIVLLGCQKDDAIAKQKNSKQVEFWALGNGK